MHKNKNPKVLRQMFVHWIKEQILKKETLRIQRNVEFVKRMKGRFLKQAIARKINILTDSELDASICLANSSCFSGEVML